MKIIGKTLSITALAAVILLSMAACALIANDDNSSSNNNNNGPTHYTGALKMSGQVWNRSETYRVNEESYSKFTGNNPIDIVVFTGTSGFTSVGSGEITNGIMNFTVAEPEDKYLLETGNLKNFFAEWDNVEISPSDTKGNNIMFKLSDDQFLNREGLFGTKTSVGLESVLFIYVNKDCQITGDYFEGPKTGYYVRTESNLALSLKKGWNTVCRRETLNAFGYVNVAMAIKNPNDFKWAIAPAPQS